MNHVVLLTSAHESPATQLLDFMRGAGINTLIEVLREEPPPEKRIATPASEIVGDRHRPIAVLWEVVPDGNIEEMRGAVRHAADTWPGIPLVACRLPANEYEHRHSNILGSQLLKRLGFFAIADDPTQLPALLRTLEGRGMTGDLGSTQRPFGVDDEAAVLARLPARLSLEALRGAFEMVATLHFASDQKIAAQTALVGFAQLVSADRWTIYLTNDAAADENISLEPLAVVGCSRTAENGGDTERQCNLLDEAIVVTTSASQTARDAATGIETISREEDGRQILAVPMITGERVPGVVEAVRDGNDGEAFNESEIDLLDALSIPVASALVNSVRIAEAERLSQTDDLTKLHNARYLRQCVVKEVKRARRYNSSVTVLFLDLDDFKRVNDAHGHLVGSHVLMEMALVILSSVRDTDVVARYGGDEFVIVLPETGIEMAMGVAERIRTMIASNVFTGGRQLRLSITASFGVANFPIHAQSPQQLVAYADAAMYEAKAAFKNCVRFAHYPAHSARDGRLALANANRATETQR